jgi:hypothetical protein
LWREQTKIVSIDVSAQFVARAHHADVLQVDESFAKRCLAAPDHCN